MRFEAGEDPAGVRARPAQALEGLRIAGRGGVPEGLQLGRENAIDALGPIATARSCRTSAGTSSPEAVGSRTCSTRGRTPRGVPQRTGARGRRPPRARPQSGLARSCSISSASNGPTSTIINQNASAGGAQAGRCAREWRPEPRYAAAPTADRVGGPSVIAGLLVHRSVQDHDGGGLARHDVQRQSRRSGPVASAGAVPPRPHCPGSSPLWRERPRSARATERRRRRAPGSPKPQASRSAEGPRQACAAASSCPSQGGRGAGAGGADCVRPGRPPRARSRAPGERHSDRHRCRRRGAGDF